MIELKALQKQVALLEADLKPTGLAKRQAQGRVARREVRRPHRRHLRDLAGGAGHPGRRRLGPRHRLRPLLRGQRPHRVPVHRRPGRPRPARRRPPGRSSTSTTRRATTSAGSRPPSTRCRSPRWLPGCSTSATTRCGRSSRRRRSSRPCSTSGGRPAKTARSATTSPTPSGTRGSSATSTRTCPRPRGRPTPCSRPRSSSRSSSSTTPSTRRSKSSAWNPTPPVGHEDLPPGLRVIDPACGSGHFLLGAFRRLLSAWETAVAYD